MKNIILVISFILSISSEINDYGNSVIYYLEAARFAESVGSTLNSDLIGIYKNLGNIVGDYGHFNLAHKFIESGIRLAIEENDSTELESLSNNKIHELLAEERYNEALKEINHMFLYFKLSEERVYDLRQKKAMALAHLGLEEFH